MPEVIGIESDRTEVRSADIECECIDGIDPELHGGSQRINQNQAKAEASSVRTLRAACIGDDAVGADGQGH